MSNLVHLDLFSGIGGFAYAVDQVWDDVKHIFCDNEPFAREVLKKHWPESEQYDDIRKITQPIKADILTGGFPCQPFSQAGKRKGTDDDRYLWPEMLRVIRLTKPTWVIAENVNGLLTMQGGWYSKMSVLTWKPKVTPYNRLLFRLQVSAHHTKGIGSGFALTPTAQNIEIKDLEARFKKRTAYRAQTGRKYFPGSLAEQLAMLPTPRVSEIEGGVVKNAELKNGSWSRQNAMGVRFGVKVKDVLEATGKSHGLPLRLQPAMLAWMMGYPEEWATVASTPDSIEQPK